jgi:ABC-2 type transport system permease protein
MLRFYFEVARTAYRRQLIYRWANFTGLLTNIFFVTVFSYVLIALYQARPQVAGYDVLDSVRYTWLIQAMIMVMTPFGWSDLMQTIRSGEVVSDLSKPCDFYWYWFSREMGRNFYYLFFRCIPTYLAGMVLFRIGLPGTWQSWLCFALAFLIGAMIGVAYRYLYNVFAFWTLQAKGIVTTAQVIALFFTGSYVPLPLFPDLLRVIASWLPFYGLMSLPAEILLDKINGVAVGFEIARQVFWLIALTLFVRWLTTRATTRVIAQGG